MKKRLLITGAFGLVGSAICKILDRDYPDIEVTKVKFDSFSNYNGDLVYDGYDYIIHAAGYGQPQMFSKDKIKTIEINTQTTAGLLQFLKKDGKFLFVSSSEVYSGAPSPHKETDIGTTTPQHPRACYIEGKRCGEAICMAYGEQGYDVKIARLALAYGPGTKKGDTRVINQFIERALHGDAFSSIDDGSSVRSYLYAEDAARLMLDIVFQGKQTVYNVGGTEKVSIAQLGQMIAQITGKTFVRGDGNGLNGAPDSVSLAMWNTLDEFPRTFTPLYEGLIKTIEYQKQLYGIQ